MHKLFKSTKAMYYITLFIGTALLFCLGASLTIKGVLIYEPVLPDYPVILFIFIWVLLVKFLFTYIAIKKMDKINAILLNDCNVQKYIDVCNQLLKRTIPIETRRYLLLCLSTALLYLGDDESAKAILDSSVDSNISVSAEHRMWCLNNLTTYYLRKDDALAAAQTLEQMKAMLEHKKISKRSRALYAGLHSYKKTLLNMKNGNYEGCEQVFCKVFESAPNIIEKVTTKRTLGEIYMYNNKPSEAKRAFEYVVDNGGDSIHVQEAKRCLDILQ